jgi:hypothetical protein
LPIRFPIELAVEIGNWQLAMEAMSADELISVQQARLGRGGPPRSVEITVSIKPKSIASEAWPGPRCGIHRAPRWPSKRQATALPKTSRKEPFRG